jgi:hypothetical protein
MQRMTEAPPEVRPQQVTPAAWKQGCWLKTSECKFIRLNFL